MGLLYDVFYPEGIGFDREIGDRYLDHLAEKVQKGDLSIIGAVAVVKNGPQESYTLCADGEWR